MCVSEPCEELLAPKQNPGKEGSRLRDKEGRPLNKTRSLVAVPSASLATRLGVVGQRLKPWQKAVGKPFFVHGARLQKAPHKEKATEETPKALLTILNDATGLTYNTISLRII